MVERLYKIYGVQAHPEQNVLNAYNGLVPVGDWTGRLDEKTWGKSTNLFCYFTDVATGDKRRLSVYHRSNYKPYKDGPNFKDEEPGGIYRITTGLSAKSSLPTFLQAEKIG